MYLIEKCELVLKYVVVRSEASMMRSAAHNLASRHQRMPKFRALERGPAPKNGILVEFPSKLAHLPQQSLHF